MQGLRQAMAVSMLSFLSIRQRIGASLVIVMGMAVVVGVLISTLSASGGLVRIMDHTGRPDRALVSDRGASGLGGGILQPGEVLTVLDAPGIRRGSDGRPIASGDVMLNAQGAVRTKKGPSNVFVWGVGPQTLTLRPEMKLVAGRMYRSGVNEVIVGRGAKARYLGLDVGTQISMPGGRWTIVGVFDSGGTLHESGFLGDIETIQAAFRAPFVNHVTVQLENVAAFDAFKEALTANPSLTVDVHHEQDYYYALSKLINDLLGTLAYGLGAVMGLGAVFGALNTMYSAVAARKIEIATLRAMGFGGGVVVVSIFAEVLALALLGALIGTVVAWSVFNGRLFTSSIFVFDLSVTPTQVVIGVVWALVIGAIGALFPAIRAVRLPVWTALQTR